MAGRDDLDGLGWHGIAGEAAVLPEAPQGALFFGIEEVDGAELSQALKKRSLVQGPSGPALTIGKACSSAKKPATRRRGESLVAAAGDGTAAEGAQKVRPPKAKKAKAKIKAKGRASSKGVAEAEVEGENVTEASGIATEMSNPGKKPRKKAAEGAADSPGAEPPLAAVDAVKDTASTAAAPAKVKRKKRKRLDKRARARLHRKSAAEVEAKLAKSERAAEAAADAALEAELAEEDALEGATAALPPAWTALGLDLHASIVRGIVKSGFATPTPIQAAVLPRAILFQQDVLGAAQTGSGKTLAFGIPMVQALLEAKVAEPRPSWFDAASPKALVLAPTRELAMQVTRHLEVICGEQTRQKALVAGGDGASLRVATVVGGLAEVKQQRVLAARPEIIVATPGRFWEMVKQAQGSADPFLAKLGRLRFLVVDEADRMVATGSYQELKTLLKYVHDEEAYEQLPPREKRAILRRRRQKGKEWMIHDTGLTFVEGQGMHNPEVDDLVRGEEATGAFDPYDLSAPLDFDVDEIDERVREALVGADSGQLRLDGGAEEAEEGIDEGVTNATAEEAGKETRPGATSDEDGTDASESGDDDAAILAPMPPRQTFLFSATLTAADAPAPEQKHRRKRSEVQVADLMHLVLAKGRGAGRKGAKAKKVFKVDLTQGGGSPAQGPSSNQGPSQSPATRLPAGLALASMKCLQQQKDCFLYYFLSQFKGKILVFVAAVTQARRLGTLLGLLGLPARSLHAQMQQRQRLKALDFFRSEASCVLVATDVAARGLDVANVRVVFHFDVPGSVDTFVHRAGRTARATRQGLSVSLVAPTDSPRHQAIVQALGAEAAFQDFPLDRRKLEGAKERVGLARKITTARLREERVSSDNSWLKRQAEEAELDLDEEMLEELGGRSTKNSAEKRAKKKARKDRVVSEEEARLAEMLERPLFEYRKSFVDVAAMHQRQRAAQEEAQRSGLTGGPSAFTSKSGLSRGAEDDSDYDSEAMAEEDGASDQEGGTLDAAADAIVAARLASRGLRVAPVA